MDSRLANGLQRSRVSVKSAHETQAEAPQPTSLMLAFPRHEKIKRGEAILSPSRFTLQRVRGTMMMKRQAVIGPMSRTVPVCPFHGSLEPWRTRGKREVRMLRYQR